MYQIYVQILHLNKFITKGDKKNIIYNNFEITLEYNNDLYKTKIAFNYFKEPYFYDILLIKYINNINFITFRLYDYSNDLSNKKLLSEELINVKFGKVSFYSQGVFNFYMGDMYYDYEIQMKKLQNEIKRLSLQNKKLKLRIEKIKNIVLFEK